MRELQKQTCEVGGITYEVAPLPAAKGLAMFRRLGKSAAPALSALSGLGNGTGDHALASIGSAIEKALESLSDADMTETCKVFAEYTDMIDGPSAIPLKSQWDLHFQGHLDELFLWLKFCIEVNFGPLLTALAATAKSGRKANTPSL